MTETITTESVIKTVTELIAKEFGVAEDTLAPDLDLTTIGADSIKVLRAVAKIERVYDIELEDEQVFGFKTIRNVATMVEATLADRVGR